MTDATDPCTMVPVATQSPAWLRLLDCKGDSDSDVPGPIVEGCPTGVTLKALITAWETAAARCLIVSGARLEPVVVADATWLWVTSPELGILLLLIEALVVGRALVWWRAMLEERVLLLLLGVTVGCACRFDPVVRGML